MHYHKTKFNFSREAFLHPGNLGFLAISVFTAWTASDMVNISEIILSLTTGAELVYLGVVPRLPRFKKWVKYKKNRLNSETKEKKIIFLQLNKAYQKKFLILKHLADQTKSNFKKLSFTSQGMLDAILKKLDHLINNYLNLLEYLQRYENYADQTLKNRLRDEIQQEETAIAQIESAQIKHTKKRRLAILKKRLHKLNDANEKTVLFKTHMETIEDVVHYIHEQSMTMNNPKEIGFQLDTLLSEMEETAQIVNELDHDITIMDDKQYDEFDVDSDYNTASETSYKQRL